MKCSKCGVDIREGNNFCSKCGNKVEVQPSSQPVQPPQSQTPVQPVAAPKKKTSTGTKVLIGCLITFLVFAIIGVVLAYFLVKKGLNMAQDEINKAQEDWVENMGGFEELQEEGEKLNEKRKEVEEKIKDTEDDISDVIPNIDNSKEPSQKPSKVVEEFMACTLGTIPQQCPSSNKDDVARSHLTINMKADYNKSGFIPQNYCIQEGPDDIKISSETETGGFAYVLVDAKYGTDNFQPLWNFVLIEQDGEWKIKDIQCLDY